MAAFLADRSKFATPILSVVLVLLLVFMGYYSWSHFKQVAKPTITTKTATGASIKKDFAQPLALSQAGKFDTALIKDNFLILDVRPVRDYQKAHIKGALSSPVSQLQGADFTSGLTIIVYGTSEPDITKALTILNNKGIKDAQILDEPLDFLGTNGYIIETQP